VRCSWIVGVAFAAALGCVGPPQVYDEFAPDRSADEQSVPLGGDALAQKKSEMQRSLRDLMHFHRTLSSLAGRNDRTGFSTFADFLNAYLGMHVDPLLSGQWQSRHPEVMGLDANLRLLKAELFIVLRDTRRAQATIDDITARFGGRENMLVEFPDGEQGTLREGLQRLQHDKWRG
jgi:hypothetical protein